MKQLPDILTSVTFWAAIGTLLSAAGAWFTYVASAVSSRKDTHEALLSLIAGLEAELDLISQWASGSEEDKGYLQTTTNEQFVVAHPEWFNPSFQIFTFDTPTLNNLTNSPQANLIRPIIQPFVNLNHSIHSFFDFIKIYQAFVYSEPAHYQSVMKMTSEGVAVSSYPEPERIYSNVIFWNE
jgi:hypothetical protein